MTKINYRKKQKLVFERDFERNLENKWKAKQNKK